MKVLVWWNSNPKVRVYPGRGRASDWRPRYLFDTFFAEAFLVDMYRRRRLYFRMKLFGTMMFEVARA